MCIFCLAFYADKQRKPKRAPKFELYKPGVTRLSNRLARKSTDEFAQSTWVWRFFNWSRWLHKAVLIFPHFVKT